MLRMLRFFAMAAPALAASAWLAGAQTVEPGKEGDLAKFLPPEPGQHSCYKRVYSAEHLKKHPKQTVAQIEFRLAYYRHEAEQNFPQGQRNYYFGLLTKLRDAPKVWEGFGECAPVDGAISCNIDCDGGGVMVKRRPDDKVLVYFREDIGRIRLAGCDGGDDDYFELEPGADDKAFLLEKISGSACPGYDDW